MVNVSKVLDGVEYECRAGTHQVACAGADESAVAEFDGSTWRLVKLGTLLGNNCGFAIYGGELHLAHEQRNLLHLALVVLAIAHLVECVVVAANDFLLACLAAHLVVADAEACHVHAHVGG